MERKRHKFSVLMIIFFFVIFFSSKIKAELELYAVYPTIRVMDQSPDVMLTGTGIDENTIISIKVWKDS